MDEEAPRALRAMRQPDISRVASLELGKETSPLVMALGVLRPRIEHAGLVRKQIETPTVVFPRVLSSLIPRGIPRNCSKTQSKSGSRFHTA